MPLIQLLKLLLFIYFQDFWFFFYFHAYVCMILFVQVLTESTSMPWIPWSWINKQSGAAWHRFWEQALYRSSKCSYLQNYLKSLFFYIFYGHQQYKEATSYFMDVYQLIDFFILNAEFSKE